MNHSHVSNAIQDNLGFIWFATWNGLVRYDGYSFHYFRPILSSSGAIDSNRIYNIKQYGDRYIWCVSSDNRLHLFDRSDNSFLSLSSTIPEIADKRVRALTPLKNGSVWVLFRDHSSIRFNDSLPLKDYRFFASASEAVPGSKSVNRFVLANGHEWIVTDRGAADITGGKVFEGDYAFVENVGGRSWLVSARGAVTPADGGGKAPAVSASGGKVRNVRVQGQYIIMGTDRGVESVKLPSGERTVYTSRPSIFIFKDSRGRIWSFGEGNDIAMIPDFEAPEALEMTVVSDGEREQMKNPQLIHETQQGMVVLKPAGGVMSYFDEASSSLRPLDFFKSGERKEYLPKRIKKFISDSHGNLWIFHSEGTDCLSFHDESFRREENASLTETRALLRDSRAALWSADGSGKLFGPRAPISTGPVYCLEESPSGEIWAGTKGNGVWRVSADASRSKVSHFSRGGAPGSEVPSDSIYDILFDGPDRMWLASFGSGLIRGEQSDGKWAFRRLAVPPSALKIRRLLQSSPETLLLATTDGLVTADVSNPDKPRFAVNRFRKEDWGLKGNDIIDIVSVDGRYFACVFGSGLSEIVSDTLLCDSIRFRHYPMNAGADSDQIRAAVADGHNIWVMSAASISCFDTRSGAFTTYSPDFFMGGIGFSEVTPINDDGVLTVGTGSGTLTFDARSQLIPAESHSLVLTGIRYQNDITVHPLDNPSELTLDPAHRAFSLRFSTMDFDRDHIVRLRYRLEDDGEGWNYVRDADMMVIYNNISAGTHRLIIQTENHDGTWSEAIAPITLRITPRLSETWWFKLGVVLAVLLLIVGLALAVVYFRRLHEAVQRKYSLLMTVDDINARLAMKSEDIPAALSIEEADMKFLEDTARVIEENLDNPDFMVEDLARRLGMSRTAYFQRMKAVTGLSPVNFIKQTRIKRALKLLESDNLSISEVAYKVGFEDPKYFSKCFKAEMMMTPTQYVESLRNPQNTP